MSTEPDPHDSHRPSPDNARFSLPPHLTEAGREEFVNRVLAFARDLRDELELEPTREGVRGRAEVQRAALRVERVRAPQPRGAVAVADPPTAPMPTPADPSGVSVRGAAIAATVTLVGYLIPYLGLSPAYLAAYITAQAVIVAVVFLRRR